MINVLTLLLGVRKFNSLRSTNNSGTVIHPNLDWNVLILARSRDCHRSTHVIVLESFSLTRNDCISWRLISRADVESSMILWGLRTVIRSRSGEMLGWIVKHGCIRCARAKRVFCRWLLKHFWLRSIRSRSRDAFFSWGIFFYVNLNRMRSKVDYSFKLVSRYTKRERLYHSWRWDIVGLRARCAALIDHVCKTLAISNACWSFGLWWWHHINLVATNEKINLNEVSSLTKVCTSYWSAWICQMNTSTWTLMYSRVS